MTDNVIRVPGVSVAAPELQAPAQVNPASQVSVENLDNQPGLAIEQGPSGFVYKVLDRATGDVIRQIPHKVLADLADDPTYDAGGLIKTSA